MGSCWWDWLFASAWIFLGDPAAGEILAWRGDAVPPRRIVGGIAGLRALTLDRERGLWFAAGERGDRLTRCRSSGSSLAPEANAVASLVLERGVRALVPGSGARCIAWLDDHTLVRICADRDALAIEERAAWDEIAALASDARGALLVAALGGELVLLEEGRLSRSAGRVLGATERPVEAATWSAEHGAWLVLESGGSGALHWIGTDGVERFRIGVPFPARAVCATSRSVWLAAADESFVAWLARRELPPRWRVEEIPAGDLSAIFARGGRVAVVGSTRWSWRARSFWRARAGGPGLLAASRPR